MKFIHLRAPYMFFLILLLLGGSFVFWDNFWVLEIFENCFEMKMCDLVKYIHLRVSSTSKLEFCPPIALRSHSDRTPIAAGRSQVLTHFGRE